MGFLDDFLEPRTILDKKWDLGKKTREIMHYRVKVSVKTRFFDHFRPYIRGQRGENTLENGVFRGKMGFLGHF